MIYLGKIINPFCTWAELAQGLRERFIAELGSERPISPHAGEVLGELANIISRCQHIGATLQGLEERDPKALDAFIRALETS